MAFPFLITITALTTTITTAFSGWVAAFGTMAASMHPGSFALWAFIPITRAFPSVVIRTDVGAVCVGEILLAVFGFNELTVGFAAATAAGGFAAAAAGWFTPAFAAAAAAPAAAIVNADSGRSK